LFSTAKVRGSPDKIRGCTTLCQKNTKKYWVTRGFLEAHSPAKLPRRAED
jgi:hypothetical protein